MKIQTSEDLGAARNDCAATDQRDALEIGCVTWAITYEGGQRGQMSRWPNGRGAVCHGSDSVWGEWTGDVLVSDDGESRYNDFGEEILNRDNALSCYAKIGAARILESGGEVVAFSPDSMPDDLGWANEMVRARDRWWLVIVADGIVTVAKPVAGRRLAGRSGKRVLTSEDARKMVEAREAKKKR